MEKSKSMADGRRIAYLKKCFTAQELYEQHKDDYSTKKEVFEKKLKSELKCSYANFNNLLKVINPREEIELLTNKN